MTTYYLINEVTTVDGQLLPGTLIDSAQDNVTLLQAAGAILVSSTNATVAAAAEVVAGIRQRAGTPEEMSEVMQAAYTASVSSGGVEDGSIVAAKLAADSVIEAKIATGAVTATKIGTGAVIEAKLGAGSVTADKIGAGAVTTAKLGDAQVTAAKLANGAGLAALLAAGLGASVNADHGDTSPVAVLAADASNDQAVLVVAVCTQTLAGDTPPTFDIGWAADPDGLIDATVLAGATAGEVFVGAGNVPATNAVQCAVTAGTGGTPAGAFSITVLALPVSP